MFILVACDNGEADTDTGANNETSPPVEETRPNETVDFEFSIDIIDDEDLAELDDYVTIDDGSSSEGLSLIFEFNQPVTNFALINVQHTGDGFAKTGMIQEVARVNNNLVFTNYRGLGTLPHLGFTFTRPDGEDVWYTLQQSMMDMSIGWQSFDWSHDYDLYDPSSNVEAVYHTVTAGETMFSISRMYRTSVDTIKELNNLTSYDITVGQILRMPDGSVKDPSLATHQGNGQSGGLGIDEAAALGIRVEWLRETLSHYIEFSYSEARGGERNVSNDTVLIAPEERLTSFAIIAIDPSPGDGLEPEVQDILFYNGALNPDQPLLIRDYLGQGTMPGSGFTFIDETGMRRFFFFLQNQADGGPQFIVLEFEQADSTFLELRLEKFGF